MACTRTAVSASPVPRPLGCWPGLRIARRYLLPPPPNSCSWVRDAVVLPITVVLLSCVGGRASMIAPNRDNSNGFRASDCTIAEYNIFSTLLFFTLLYFVDCFAGNNRKCCFQRISARICAQNGISAPVILFFVVFWDNCVCCLARPFYQLFPPSFPLFGSFRYFRAVFLRLSTEMIENVSKSAFLPRKCLFTRITAPEMSF